MTRMTTFGATLGVLALAAMPAFAQGWDGKSSDPIGGPEPEVTTPGRPDKAYGTVSQSTYTITSMATSPLVSDTTWNYIVNGLQRTRTGGSIWFQGPITISSGSIMTAFEIEICDTDPVNSISGFIHRCPIGGGACTTIASVASGGPAIPGCVTLVDNTITTPVVDQENFSYEMEVALGGATTANSFGSMRLNWQRQVSPGPGVATFADVPTSDPRFRFVEAFVASGLTSGCGGGNYCPDAAVTRGQIAVFLASALGMHFPN